MAERGQGRVPPHNLAAEESLLGSLLLSRDAVAVTIELDVQAADFYKPTHQHIFQAIRATHARQIQVDMVTVADELRRAGLLDDIGGVEYLNELSMVRTPASSNAVRYAQIVRDTSQLRNLILAGSEIADIGYDEPADVARALAEAEARIAAIIAGGGGTLLDGFYPDIGELDTGDDRDDVQPWIGRGVLRRGQRMLVVAKAGLGKALALDTPILTTGGWTTMEKIQPGDRVFTPDGTPTTVLACSEIHDELTYRVEFSDGATIDAGERHRWRTVDGFGRNNYQWNHKIVTTADIAASVAAAKRKTPRWNHLIECCDPLQYPECDMPFDPYMLGYWLGDGDSIFAVITVANDDLPNLQPAIRHAGLAICRLTDNGTTSRIGLVAGYPDDTPPRTILNEIGVLGNKHIPTCYTRATVDRRLALLQGIVDSDGHVGIGGRVEITLTNERLAHDVFDLVISLGMKPTIYESDAKLHGRTVGRRWRMTFRTTLPVATLPRKAERLDVGISPRHKRRYIVSCTDLGVQPVRCIQVDRTDGMWLAGRHLVPTHNSLLLRQLCFCAVNGVHPWTGQVTERPRRALIVELEGGALDITASMRMLLKALQRCCNVASMAALERPALLHRENGIDLRSPVGLAALEAAIQRSKPEIVSIGPVKYMSLMKPGENYETAALQLMALLNGLIAKYRIALVMEAHFSRGDHGAPGGSERWVDWPDVGFTLHPPEDDMGRRMVAGGDGLEVTAKTFRNPRDADIWVPSAFVRGKDNELPWSVQDWSDPYKWGVMVYASRYGGLPAAVYSPHTQQEF